MLQTLESSVYSQHRMDIALWPAKDSHIIALRVHAQKGIKIYLNIVALLHALQQKDRLMIFFNIIMDANLYD